MIVIRQHTVRTSVGDRRTNGMFLAMGTYGLVRFRDQRGRRAGIALVVVAGVLGLVSVRSITRGTIVATLRSSGLELHSGHFARWGLIRWDDIDEVFLFRTVGMRMIGLRLKDRGRYAGRLSAWARWSLWMDRQLSGGADAHLSAAAVRADPTELARLIQLFARSPTVRDHFGREDLLLEFPTDVGLAEITTRANESTPL